MNLSQKQIDILEIVETLMSKEGFNAISVRQVAKAAKINVAMIAYYFGSKDEMIEKLLKYKLSKSLIRLKDMYSQLPKDIAPRQKMMDVLTAYIDGFFEFHTTYEISEIIFQHQKIKEKCMTEVREFRFTLINIFREIVDEGREKENISFKAEIEIFVGSMVGTILYFLRHPDYAQQFWAKDNKEEITQEKIKKYFETIISLMWTKEDE